MALRPHRANLMPSAGMVRLRARALELYDAKTSSHDARASRTRLSIILLADDQADPLGRALARCGNYDPAKERRWYCGSVACPVCAISDGRRYARAILWRDLIDVPTAELAWVTIITHATPDLASGTLAVRRHRDTLRQVLDRATIVSRRPAAWGWREADRVDRTCISETKASLLDTLDPDCNQRLWVHHVHALIHLDGWSHEMLALALRQAYPGPRRVHVAPLRASQGRKAALTRFSIYASKSRLTVDNGDGRIWMSADDSREFARWSQARGRGWFRFSIYTGKARDRPLW